MDLETRIRELSLAPERTAESLSLLAEFRAALNAGAIRVAEPEGAKWRVNHWVKEGILLHLVLGEPRGGTGPGATELDTLPTREFTPADRVRVLPGGYVRDGTFLGAGTTCMAPAFVNIGVWVGGGSLIDSNVTIGLGAQIGENVRISSGSQIGGFIEPLERLPTIVCDRALVGGNCGIYDGVFVSPGAILTAGTILTGQTRLYDVVHNRLYMANDGQPLVVPPGAIVVPGSRPMTGGAGRDLGLLINVPVVVGYREGDAIPSDLLGQWLGN